MPTKKFELDDILKMSDITSAGTSALISTIYGRSGVGRRAAESVLISIVARNLSGMFTSVGEDVTQSTKNQVWVALLNALVAFGMKQSVAKRVVHGVSADLMSDYLYTAFEIDDKVLIGGLETKTTDADAVDAADAGMGDGTGGPGN